VTFTFNRARFFGFAGLATGFGLGLAAPVLVRAGVFRAQPETAPVAAALAQAPQPAPAGPTRVDPGLIATEGRPFRGSAMARVTLVEFTDYQCPFCKRHATLTLPALLERYGNRIRYVVRNFPIEQLHPYAIGAAEAAECAAVQGRFWEYHDALFRTDDLTPAGLRRLAAGVRLNLRAWDRCVAGHEQASVVQRDLAAGSALGVAGTPAIFVNGQMIDGAQPLSVFVALIDAALAAP